MHGRRRSARALAELAGPLVAQARDAPLSPASHSVCSWTWRVLATSTSLWAMVPASSRSEMEMEPRGLSAVTRAWCTSAVKGERHTMGAAAGFRTWNQTSPYPQARVRGGNRNKFAEASRSRGKRVGKGEKIGHGVKHVPIQPHAVSVAPAESILQYGEQPARTRVAGGHGLELAQNCMPVRKGRPLRGGRTMSRRAYKRVHRCGGNNRVQATVSRSHPSMHFCVLQFASSPCWSFFTEVGSLRRTESPESRGWSTASIACKVARRSRR